MIPLSVANKAIKNSLFDNGVWLQLITLTNRDETVTLRIVNNTEDITYQGNVFTRFPCQLGEINESTKGELPTVNLTISNVDRLVQSYIENDPNVGTGWAVHIDIVHSSDIANGIAEVTYDFKTMNAVAEETIVTFSCGISNPIRSLFPRLRMLPNACQHTFKRGACTYNGNDETCQKRLQDCRIKFTGVSKIPFLGFPGIPSSGIYQ